MRENRLRSNPAAAPVMALALLALCLLAPAAARAQWTQPTPPDTNISNTNTGNVGIGTTTPNFKLEVSGSTSRNTMAVTGNGDSVGYAGVRISAQSTIGIAPGRASAYNLHMRKDSWYTGDSSGPSFIIETNSPGSGYAAPFIITPQNHVILNGGRGAGGDLGYGWVGVGTTAPASNLHVNSAGGFAAMRVSGAGGGVVHFSDTSAPANQRLYQWRSEGGLFRLALANDAENGYVQQNLLVANSAGNVGIGTAAPGTRLHVGGGVRIDGTTGRFYLGTAAVTGARGLEFIEENATTYSIRHHDPSVAWRNIAINPYGGNLGVGTLAPAFKLDVAGQVRSSSGGFVFPDGTVQTTAAAGGGGTLTGVTAGVGLVGGGTSGAPTIDIGVGTGLTAAADSLSVNYGSAAGTAVQGNTTLTVTAGTGLTGGGTSTLGTGGTLTLNVGAGTGLTAGADSLSVNYGSAAGTAVEGNTTLTVTAGTGLTGGGASTLGTGGTLTLNVGAGTGLTAAADSLSVNYGSGAGTAVEGNKTLTVTAGPGMTGGGQVTLGAGGSVTLENSDRGSAQKIFKSVANAAGAVQFSADTNVDALSFEGTGGTTVSFVPGSKKIVINSTSGPGTAPGWTDGGATVTTTNAAARVGIGLSDPTELLEVSGAGEVKARATGAISAGMQFKETTGAATWSEWQQINDRLRLNTHDGTTTRADVLTVLPNGQVGIGTETPGANLSDPTVKLDVNGSINVSGNINAKYQDVAEWVPTVQKLVPGTVVILDAGRTNHVLASADAYDTKVAGVVSAQPGVILGMGGEGKVMVATTGRVKVKVDASHGAIKVGDLLVTSGVEGVAMKSVPVELGGTQIHRPGTIIGKALEPLAQGVGEILVLLSLQ